MTVQWWLTRSWWLSQCGMQAACGGLGGLHLNNLNSPDVPLHGRPSPHHPLALPQARSCQHQGRHATKFLPKSNSSHSTNLLSLLVLLLLLLLQKNAAKNAQNAGEKLLQSLQGLADLLATYLPEYGNLITSYKGASSSATAPQAAPTTSSSPAVKSSAAPATTSPAAGPAGPGEATQGAAGRHL